MAETLRKPLAASEAKEVWSIRFAPCERTTITDAAISRGLAPSEFAHDLCLIGLNVISSPTLMESYVRETAVLRASHANGNGAKE